MGLLNTRDREHHAIEDFNEVHARLSSKINLQQGLIADNTKATQMESYLRALKLVNTNNSDVEKDSIASALDDLAYDDLMELSQSTLKFLNRNGRSMTSINQLFNREHGAFYQKGKLADDIFEEELYAFLQGLQEKATGSINYNLGLSLTGGQMTNIGKFATLSDDVVKDITQELLEALIKDYGWTREQAKLALARLKSVSGKVDITSFKANIDFVGELDPKWQKMFEAFAGANFTLKNYTSRAEIMEIHLGNSSPYRAISATLGDLGFPPKDSDHIYYHARTSYYYPPDYKGDELAAHIYHTRLYYELTGYGLYDTNGNPISGADFIIYNDPFTENIFVRSTKQILYDLIFGDQSVFSGDPWKAITLKKAYFI